jgi:hypothetical protein
MTPLLRLVVLSLLVPACATVGSAPAPVLFGATRLEASTEVQRRYAGRSVSGEYQVCLDAEGAVTKVEVLQPIYGAEDDVVAALRRYPFGKQPEPRCRRVRQTFTVPLPDLMRYRDLGGGRGLDIHVAENEPLLPPSVRRYYAGRHPAGRYLLFVDPSGRVDGVRAVTSIPGCDDYVIEKLVRTSQSSFNEQFPMRYGVTVGLDFPGHADGPPTPMPTAAKAISAVPPQLPEMVKIHNAGRILVAAYKLGVDVDGSITRVDVIQSIPEADDAIINALRQWRFEPIPLPVSVPVRFTYDVRH